MSHEIEFLARFPKMKEIELSEDEEQSRMVDRLVSGEPMDGRGKEYEIDFEYAPITVAMEDIVRYYEYDKNHTTIKFFDGDAFVVKYKYKFFKILREHVTGNFIQKAEDFKIAERLTSKANEIQAILTSVPITSNGTAPAGSTSITTKSDE